MQTEFTFPDTGIRVKINKVSPFVLQDVEESIPEPAPPEQEVDYGPPRGKVRERNFADPAYALLLNEHRRQVLQAYRRAVILRGVEPCDPKWKEQVEEYREFIRQQTGKAPTEVDLVVYVLRICVGTMADLNDLLEVITSRSMPTPEAVAAAKESFPGKV